MTTDSQNRTDYAPDNCLGSFPRGCVFGLPLAGLLWLLIGLAAAAWLYLAHGNGRVS